MGHLSFLGKQIHKYDPQIECSEKEFQKVLQHFSRIETLRGICKLSSHLEIGGGDVFQFGSTPVNPEILHFFASHVIRCATDLTKAQMPDSQFEIVLRMCWKLSQEQVLHENYTASELLIRMGYVQFVTQQKRLNSFTRNLYLFTDLWKRVSSAKEIDITREIESLIGISYDFALFFALALTHNKDGHFWAYDQKIIDDLKSKTGLELTVEDHQKFIDWCSGSYEEIIAHSGLISPFLSYPIIESKFKPTSDSGEVYMIVAPNFIFEK